MRESLRGKDKALFLPLLFSVQTEISPQETEGQGDGMCFRVLALGCGSRNLQVTGPELPQAGGSGCPS